MNSGPCLICQRPNSPLRRPYGYLCKRCEEYKDGMTNPKPEGTP